MESTIIENNIERILATIVQVCVDNAENSANAKLGYGLNLYKSSQEADKETHCAVVGDSFGNKFRLVSLVYPWAGDSETEKDKIEMFKTLEYALFEKLLFDVESIVDKFKNN